LHVDKLLYKRNGVMRVREIEKAIDVVIDGDEIYIHIEEDRLKEMGYTKEEFEKLIHKGLHDFFYKVEHGEIDWQELINKYKEEEN
jgi:hypothetical protein